MIRSSVELITNNLEYLLKFPYTVFINQSTYFLDGLFIYLYVLVLKNKRVLTLKTVLLFLPFLIFSITTLIIAYKTETVLLKEFIIEVEDNKSTTEWNTTGSLYFILVIVFNLLIYIHSLKLFRKSSVIIKNTISKKHDLSYKWQKMFINSWFFLYFIPFAITFIIMYYKGSSNVGSEIIFSISILLLTFIFGLKKIKIKYEELKIMSEEVTLKQLINPKPKYGTLKLDDEKTNQLKTSIDNLIKDEETLSDMDLNLSSFSKKLKEKDYLVSQVINTLYNKSFQDFINSHRIEYSKKILSQKPDNKIIHVALDCGYKSTVTFNRQFKKYVGMTPTEYKNNLLKN